MNPNLLILGETEMKHFTRISKLSNPAEARSLLEWTQFGVIAGAFTTAYNTLTTALDRKGKYETE
jgi:hypothetical protein